MRSGARLIRATVAVRLLQEYRKNLEIPDSQPFIPGINSLIPRFFKPLRDEDEDNETDRYVQPWVKAALTL
jgi:hypothetical protein